MVISWTEEAMTVLCFLTIKYVNDLGQLVFLFYLLPCEIALCLDPKEQRRKKMSK